ncbi:MAG: hypothetical protein O4861_21100 [Trichodesmium sp. St16_bin4-tuft]|nr:hypothetical protein [Trichodesmium sp. MAG_R01]MDE5068621.1 hypothetical protein [Trichodesmium sp. St4_bin8_1]MDE5072684.1 hypothetical protein [Trichodesmium sp. St5_bin8]MDE5076965.1 hypothetical protein [Trichodesmium sp. St2_bin6]MDE5090866.1 hypothetical protein [Trichodesmium sp. St18_bin3_1_1]MDE5100692.1 hypothetical protein [Trichodesmium sp. St16_bin4-tuft]MDE5101896.1 hypothetical protein [Trichodesmium sp. St19_bin2]
MFPHPTTLMLMFHSWLIKMEVGTTQGAFPLKISRARVRVLLKEGRIQGTCKNGRSWLISFNS